MFVENHVLMSVTEKKPKKEKNVERKLLGYAAIPAVAIKCSMTFNLVPV